MTLAMIDVLKGLDAAHSRRDELDRPAAVLHRDVTPPNILLDTTGTVKLADFGMARAMDRGRMTRPDIVKGKLSYLAPELVLGLPASVQSDLFGVGVVMWEALTSQRLFDAPTDYDVVKLVREARVPLLSMRRRSLPVGLTAVVHRALERDANRRYQSAREMARDLSQVLRVLPSPPDWDTLADSVRHARHQLRLTRSA
jgi:eukaryotic-like serine/threonine-protein kinase